MAHCDDQIFNNVHSSKKHELANERRKKSTNESLYAQAFEAIIHICIAQGKENQLFCVQCFVIVIETSNYAI